VICFVVVAAGQIHHKRTHRIQDPTGWCAKGATGNQQNRLVIQRTRYSFLSSFAHCTGQSVCCSSFFIPILFLFVHQQSMAPKTHGALLEHGGSRDYTHNILMIKVVFNTLNSQWTMLPLSCVAKISHFQIMEHVWGIENSYCCTYSILAVMNFFPINVHFSQNQLLTMLKVLKSCLTLLFTTCPKAWWAWGFTIGKASLLYICKIGR